MKSKFTRGIVTGAALIAATSVAQAFCIVATGFPSNDVAIELPLEAASPTVAEVDMNGVQGGWATHGTSIVISPVVTPASGGDTLVISSWTRNTMEVTEEWVCRMVWNPIVGTPVLATGSGVVHTVDHVTPSFADSIQECQFLNSDCP